MNPIQILHQVRNGLCLHPPWTIFVNQIQRELVHSVYTPPPCPETLLPPGCHYGWNSTQPRSSPSYLLSIMVRSLIRRSLCHLEPTKVFLPPKYGHQTISTILLVTIFSLIQHSLCPNCVLWKIWTLVSLSTAAEKTTLSNCHFIMFMLPVGQKLKQETTRMAGPCSAMSAASAGRTWMTSMTRWLK